MFGERRNVVKKKKCLTASLLWQKEQLQKHSMEFSQQLLQPVMMLLLRFLCRYW